MSGIDSLRLIFGSSLVGLLAGLYFVVSRGPRRLGGGSTTPFQDEVLIYSGMVTIGVAIFIAVTRGMALFK